MALGTFNNINPYRSFESLRRELDRAFDRAGNDWWDFPFSRISFLPGRAARAYPLINLSEDKDNLYVEALAPGIAPDSLTVSVERGQLILSGEKHAPEGVKPEQWHRCERAAGRFTRTFNLPAEIDAEKILARYENGLLRVTLPKSEAAKPKQIAVKVV